VAQLYCQLVQVKQVVAVCSRAKEEAKAAGADIVGMEDLAERVKAGDMPFDVVIASPDTMRVGTWVSSGSTWLMPNPKVGTVTPDVATAKKRKSRSGTIPYRQSRYYSHNDRS
jgi:large subunit ribosomal protein L1